jgi:hypothetical protein
LSHCVLLPLIDGELELPLAPGDALDESLVPLVEEPVLPDPPTLCDDDCAIAAAENANSAAIVAVERVFNMGASPMVGSGTTAPGTNASTMPSARRQRGAVLPGDPWPRGATMPGTGTLSAIFF